MNINEHLAINVMGWRMFREYYFGKNLPPEGMQYYKFTPDKDISQAMDCLKAMGNKREGVLHIFDDKDHSPNGFGFELFSNPGEIFINENPAKAVSDAIAKETGWEERDEG